MIYFFWWYLDNHQLLFIFLKKFWPPINTHIWLYSNIAIFQPIARLHLLSLLWHVCCAESLLLPLCFILPAFPLRKLQRKIWKGYVTQCHLWIRLQLDYLIRKIKQRPTIQLVNQSQWLNGNGSRSLCMPVLYALGSVRTSYSPKCLRNLYNLITVTYSGTEILLYHQHIGLVV